MSNSGRMPNGVNGNRVLAVGRRTNTALGRRPLAVSMRTNKAVNENAVRSDANNAFKEVLKREAASNKPLRFKASKTVAVNDENAENATVPAAEKSKIPIGDKKLALKKTKPKEEPVVEPIAPQKLGFSSLLLIPHNVENIDSNDGDNVFLTPDYVNEIYGYLRQLESEQTIRSNHLSAQKEVTPRMRSILVDWLIHVHHQFRLLPETLYLGISIMDRFFQRELISKEKIQLVGVTAFFIASKFEEVYPPDIKDFVMICDKLYNKKDVIKMELAILKSLNFELGRPLPLHFLRRFSKAAHADSRIHSLAKYLMELTLMEYECSHWLPSLSAATSLYVTLKVLTESDDSALKWTPTLEFYSTYSEAQLMASASAVCKIIIKSDRSKFQNCRQKYSSSKLMQISQIPQLKAPIIAEMAAFQC